jgi:hypothetical protein
MKNDILIYSLKVWLTSVVVAPLLFLTAMLIKDGLRFSSQTDLLRTGICLYLLYIAFGLFFSIITWLVFWLLIELVVFYILKPAIMCWIIFFTGISLTAATFLLATIFFFPIGLVVDPAFLVLMLCYCFCIGCGVWLYKIKK